MFEYIDKPSITKRPDKPVRARKVPLSMNQGGNNMERVIITENKVEKMYQTDAPLGLIIECFDDVYTREEFITQIIEQGYKIEEYCPSIRINFDKKVF